MNILENIDAKLEGIGKSLRKTPRKELLSSYVIYTVLFLAIGAVLFIPDIKKSGILIAGDGNSMYYPHLVNFRRSLLEFCASVKKGSPQLPLINYNASFGSDNILSFYSLLPCFPLYALCIFLPESALPAFYTVTQIILLYLTGFSFIYLCKYFNRDLLISGFFAAGYSFCGHYIFWDHGHPQFCYMMIAFPLMVVGLDRVLNRTGWKLLTFSVFFAGFCSFTFLLYTLPFLAVFAFFRVLFLKKEHFFRELLKDFLLCCGPILLGVLLCGITFMPVLYSILNSNRAGTETNLTLGRVLLLSIPGIGRLGSLFIKLTKFGVFSFILPCAMITLMDIRDKIEKKVYMIVTMLLVAMPIVSYAVNGFMYEQVRWGFIPAMLICYLAVSGLEKLDKLDKTSLCLFSFTAIVFTIIMDIEHEYVATIFASVMIILVSIPFFSKRAGKIVDFLTGKILKAIGWMKANKDGSKRFIVALLLILIFVPLILFSIALIFGFKMGWECLFPGMIIGISALVIYKHKSLSRILTLVMAAVFAVSAMTQAHKKLPNMFFGDLLSDPIYDTVSQIETDPDRTGRIEDLDSALPLHYEPMTFEEYEKYLKKGSYLGDGIPFTTSPRFNNCNNNDSLFFGVPTVKTFNNMMDEDLIGFYDRIGMNSNGFTSIVNINSMSMVDPLYSLFGVDYFFTNNDIKAPYGACDHIQADVEGFTHDIYRNSTAFPTGVTYDSYISNSDYEGLSRAYLPHAMMESAYLEGYDGETRNDLADRDALCEVSYDLETKDYDTNTMDIEYLENIVHLNDDISDKFLYISFEGVMVRNMAMIKYESPYVLFDDGSYFSFAVTNEYSDWSWKTTMDHYCIALGYKDHDINEMRFVTPFKYDSFKIYAIPREWFDEAYKARTAETLTNIERGGSSLEGDITVTGQKLLSVNYLNNEGWSVYVDGEKRELLNVNNLFLGVMLDEGTHHVEFRYFTPWLKEGIIISAAGLVIFIAAGLLTRRKKN